MSILIIFHKSIARVRLRFPLPTLIFLPFVYRQIFSSFKARSEASVFVHTWNLVNDEVYITGTCNEYFVVRMSAEVTGKDN